MVYFTKQSCAVVRTESFAPATNITMWVRGKSSHSHRASNFFLFFFFFPGRLQPRWHSFIFRNFCTLATERDKHVLVLGSVDVYGSIRLGLVSARGIRPAAQRNFVSEFLRLPLHRPGNLFNKAFVTDISRLPFLFYKSLDR